MNLTGQSLSAFRKRLFAWYGRHKRAMPWRGTRDAYRIWISEIMLQQTRVTAARPYYERFLRRFPTVRALARARSEEVLRYWAGLGYYSRARNLHRAAKTIVGRHGGKFPRAYEAALALPGVGRYTAAAVLSIAYGEPLAVLDGNVARVLARLGAVRGDLKAKGRWKRLEESAQELMDSLWDTGRTKRMTFEVRSSRLEERRKEPGGGEERKSKFENRKEADGKGKAGAPLPHSMALRAERRKSKWLPDRLESLSYERRQDAGGTKAGEWNQAMMELGATLCTPRAPRCAECPVARWCKAYKQGIAEMLPASRKKRAPTKIAIAAAVLLDPRGRTLLVKPAKAETNGLFSRMWQFPAVEVSGNAAAELARHLRAWNGGGKAKALTQRAQRRTEDAEKNGAGETMVALAEAKHSVTFRKITLRPFLMRVRELPAVEGARVVQLSKLNEIAVSSATRKIAREAEKGVRGVRGGRGFEI